MELINWVLSGLLTVLMCLYFIKARQLDKHVDNQNANVNDLAFRHNEGIEFLEYQFAKFNYQVLAQKNQLKFKADSSLAEVLRHKGAREILVKSKLIKKKDEPINNQTLGELTRDLKIELDPILVKLNMLETSI